jgi:hypothetical protein
MLYLTSCEEEDDEKEEEEEEKEVGRVVFLEEILLSDLFDTTVGTEYILLLDFSTRAEITNAGSDEVIHNRDSS